MVVFHLKIRNLKHESKSFNVSSFESLSSHIFRATQAINTYEGGKIKITKGELGHKKDIKKI